MNLDMNRIIWAVWFLTTLLIPKTTATPLLDISGNVRFSDDEDDILFDPSDEDDILFDPSDEDDILFDPSDEATKCAKGSTFCEQIETYPTDEFTSKLKEENKYAELFGTDLVNPITLVSRFGGDEEEEEENEEQLCLSRVRIIYPQAAQTQDKTWRYIVNHSNYTQGVRVEECIRHKRQCQMSQHFPIGYKAQCKQKFVYRQLVAIDENGYTVKDLFKMPSCCQCVLILTYGKRKRIF